MWDKGTLEIDGTKVEYWVKHYEEGSEFGINEGRISKLDCRADGEMILHYERGGTLSRRRNSPAKPWKFSKADLIETTRKVYKNKCTK